MSVKDWSKTAASNTGIIDGMSLDGSVMTVNQVDNAFRDFAAQVASQLGDMGYEGSDIASASTVDLNNATGWSLDVTGTTTITSFGTVDAGQIYILRFAGALTLTHNSTSLILPGAANITTAAGDVAIMKSEGSGNWRCVSYQRASGVPVAGLPTSSTDNTLPRFNGTAGALQTSGVTVDDSNNVTGVAGLTASGTVSAATFSGDGIATSAQFRDNTANKVLETDGVWSSAEIVGLTDAATIAVDLSTGFNFSVSIAGNRTLGNPTNTKVGQSGCIGVSASGGTRTLDKASNWKSTTSFPISLAAGESAFLFYTVRTSTSILVSVMSNPT